MTERQKEYLAYLESPHWKALRGEALKRDGNKCTRCGSGIILQVHHMIYRTRFEDSLVEDLITLCKECHQAEHGKNPKVKRVKKAKRVKKSKAFVVITNWETLCRARSNKQITRAEFVKQKKIYRPGQRHHRPVNCERRIEGKRRWWPGMYEGKNPGETYLEVDSPAIRRYQPNF